MIKSLGTHKDKIMIVIIYDILRVYPCHDLDHKRIVGMIKSLHIYIMYVTNITYHIQAMY